MPTVCLQCDHTEFLIPNPFPVHHHFSLLQNEYNVLQPKFQKMKP